MLKIGIVGLANVGKSTLFNALTNAGALAANYPFATIEPNVGIVPVPDPRLEVLAKMYNTNKIIPATIEFVDIAGLIAGAHKGEGLGNKFLAHIRECDAILHVVRAFTDDNIVRVGKDAKDDIETVNTELELADLETIQRVLGKQGKSAKNGSADVKTRPKWPTSESQNEKNNNLAIPDVERSANPLLRDLRLMPDVERSANELLGDLSLLTQKPVIYMFNMDEQNLSNTEERKTLSAMVAPVQATFVNAKLESEMSEMPKEEKAEFLKSYGVEEDGLAQLVRAAYTTLGLQSFLTAGKKEVRAWTVKKGATAPEAAGVIHTDFQRGFIAASICDYGDLVRLGSEKAVREAGLLRTEGKTYAMREGDVVEFKFNV